jgi:hypothetical protein
VAFKKKNPRKIHKFFWCFQKCQQISNFYWHFLNAHKNQFPTWGNLIPS